MEADSNHQRCWLKCELLLSVVAWWSQMLVILVLLSQGGKGESNVCHIVIRALLISVESSYCCGFLRGYSSVEINCIIWSHVNLISFALDDNDVCCIPPFQWLPFWGITNLTRQRERELWKLEDFCEVGWYFYVASETLYFSMCSLLQEESYYFCFFCRDVVCWWCSCCFLEHLVINLQSSMLSVIKRSWLDFSFLPKFSTTT
jgi:hypothetical protein